MAFSSKVVNYYAILWSHQMCGGESVLDHEAINAALDSSPGSFLQMEQSDSYDQTWTKIYVLRKMTPKEISGVEKHNGNSRELRLCGSLCEYTHLWTQLYRIADRKERKEWKEWKEWKPEKPFTSRMICSVNSSSCDGPTCVSFAPKRKKRK